MEGEGKITKKIVRDYIPKILEEKGITYEIQTASQEEYEAGLIDKALEEAKEFHESGGDIEELADLVEVVNSLKTLPRYQDLEAVRMKKLAERGGFEERIILKGTK